MARSISVLTLLSSIALSVPSLALAQPLVVLDPGHGGADPGAVGCSLEEEDVVLDVALRVRGVLEGSGVRVTLTRDTDAAVGLSARATFANSMGADGFVSVHSNANSGTPASGTETFIATAAGARSLALATGVQAAMIATWGLPDRGVKRANFVVIRDTVMPAALAELAFTNRCTPDAALLGDPAERARVADAIARAILEWLGVTPGMSEGIIRGVVFEDQGVGLEDLSVRLPGASVMIVGGASVTADSPDANWMFTVPVGSVMVEASAPGHVTTRRTCDVSAGATTWCSVGLLPDGVAPDAGPVAEPDASVVIDVDAASSPADAGPPGMRDTVDSCGCRAAGRGAGSPMAAWMLVCALGLAWMSRRGRAAPTAWLALIVLAGGCGAPEVVAPHAAPPLERGAAPSVRVVAAFTQLHERHALALGPIASPVVSPDGAHVLVPSADFRTLSVLDVRTGEARVLVSGERAGYEPRWQDEGSEVAYRGPEDTDTGIPSHAIALDSSARAVTLTSSAGHVWIARGEGQDAVLLRREGVTRTVSAGGDRYLLPSIANDGSHVVYWGIETGVIVYRVSDGASVIVGDPLLDRSADQTPGAALSSAHFGHPRFDASGRYVVFERTRDDGHAFTEGTLFVADLARAPVLVAALEVEGIARAPSLSAITPSGEGVLAFVREDQLVIADVRVEGRSSAHGD